MKKFDVFYFMAGEETTVNIEGVNMFDLQSTLEKILHPMELESVYKIEEIYTHDDEKYDGEVVDDEILNGFVGAPN